MTATPYTWGAKSTSDESKPLGYHTEEEAKAHVDTMNQLLTEWDTNNLWNKGHWKVKPEPWVHFKL